LPIASAERGDQRRHISIPFYPTEALDGFEHAGGDPAQHHLPTPPALDVALHVTRATEQTLGGVRGGQRAAQSRGEIQRQDGEGFIEAFPEALGRTRMLGLPHRLPAAQRRSDHILTIHHGSKRFPSAR
jgi:hypothetical protein